MATISSAPLPQLVTNPRTAFAAWVWTDDSETTWQEFVRLAGARDPRFAATVPASLPSPLEDPRRDAAHAPTVPLDLAPAPFPTTMNLGLGEPPAAASAEPAPTVESVMQMARRNGRVCPVLPRWQALYERLPDKRQSGNVWLPVAPVSRAAWNVSSALSKRLVLREHVEWAAWKGVLQDVHDFLAALPEEDWHHIGAD